MMIAGVVLGTAALLFAGLVGQARAEDALLAVVRDIGASTKLFAGYLILEGGADNDEVYTFSLFHYFVCGVEARF